MGKRRYELDTRVLTVFFFVAMPFVAFGSFVVVSIARGLLQDSLGESLEQRALQTKLLLERYVGDQIIHLHLLSLDPQVRQAVANPPRARGADEAKKLEQAWAAGSDPKLVAPLVDSPLAGRLREAIQVRPALKLLQVVDVDGRLVAASSRAGRLLNGESAWFTAVAHEGLWGQRAYVGDIHRPEGSAMALLEIAYPISAADGRRLGAVRCLLDAADLYSVLAPVRVGRTGHAVLLSSSDLSDKAGLILASDEGQRVLRQKFAGFESILAAKRERRGYWIIPEIREKAESGWSGVAVIESARIVGYSPVEQVPNVQWLVTVEQDLAEATAPIQRVTRYLWIHFIGAFGSVILLALYLSFKLETPVIEEELHLHEEHVPASMRPTEG